MVNPQHPALAPLIMHSPRECHALYGALALTSRTRSRAPCRLFQLKLSGSLVSAAMNMVLNQTSCPTLEGLAKILNDSFLDILIHIQQFLVPIDIIPLPSVRVLQKSSIEIVCI